ncbi:MAG TPA: DUF2961 domain-containing protein [Acidimicrobiales bacterium]
MATGQASQQASSSDGDPGSAAGEGLNALNQLPLLNASVHDAGASSHDPNGENGDSGNYLYQDAQGDYVLMEAEGPGVIDRIWVTGALFNGKSSSARSFGNLEFFFDGETTPRIDLPADTLFSGSSGPFLAPLCGNGGVSSGGFYCDVRMPFAKSVRVVSTGDPAYYNIGYETYPAGTPVQTFDPTSAQTLETSEAEVAVAKRAGSDPEILPAGSTAIGGGTLQPGETRVISNIQRAGTISAIKVSVAPNDDEALHDVWLQARWDGSSDLAINAPLADLFLSGAGSRSPALGLLAGFIPASNTGYLYFPMPFVRSAEIDLVNNDGHPINAFWQVEQSPMTYSGIGSSVGEFHATYAAQDPTQNGSDYVMLDQPGQGKVVGISYTEEGPLDGSETLFMEGNEHVYFDGSQTPAFNGTGTEDFFDGGYYYANGPFTLFDHGATDVQTVSPIEGETSQYRLLLQDPWNFRDGIVLGIQHGAGDGLPTANHSVVFWYGNDLEGMDQTDSIDVGNTASLSTADYTSTSVATSETLRSFYEGEDDGNLSSPLFDATIILGAVPPPPGTDPRHQSVTDTGLVHPPGSIIRFNVKINADNEGVVLRRQLDQATFEQQAQVFVDGVPAGVWMTPANTSASGATAKYDTYKRWADSDFPIAGSLTKGRSQLSIELQVLKPVFVPPGLADGWTDFRYTVFSLNQ